MGKVWGVKDVITKKKYYGLMIGILLLLWLTGCTEIGEKTANMSVIYGVTMVMSLLLLIGYCGMMREKDGWFILLFLSVLVVNIGYFTLSVSQELEEALLANRISYLGSVFLPMAMLMILLNVTRVSYPKWIVGVLLSLALVVFLIAASPGYLDVYYREVTLERINGVAVLQKVYGPLHRIYLFYLLGYFAVMIAVVVGAVAKGRLESGVYSAILVIAVFVNIGVWLLEQLVKIDFECLSVSYIISELFLLGLSVLIRENERLKHVIAAHDTKAAESAAEVCVPERCEQECGEEPTEQDEECFEQYLSGLDALTTTERAVFTMYISGCTTKEIMSELNIKENTLKFHNKNIYGKLGVSSRKQLIAVYKKLKHRNLIEE